MKLFNGTRSAAAVLGLLAATTLTACGSDDSAAVASDYDPIVIGVGVDATYAPFFLAESEGMFEDAGLDVTLQQFSAGGLAVDAIAGKEVQIAAASPATMVAKQASNAELRSLFKYFTSDATIGVVGNEDVSDAADIETFGVMPGVSQYDAYKYLQSEGVDPEGVKFEVVQDPSTLPPLTQKGDLDAYVLWEPWVTNGVGLGLQLLASTGSFGQPAEQVVTADATWLEGHERRWRSSPRCSETPPRTSRRTRRPGPRPPTPRPPPSPPRTPWPRSRRSTSVSRTSPTRTWPRSRTSPTTSCRSAPWSRLPTCGRPC